MKSLVVMLGIDGAVLLVYGAVELLLVPSGIQESYWSYGRFLWGFVPAILGVASVSYVVWFSIRKDARSD
jgi:hypothetical protein